MAKNSASTNNPAAPDSTCLFCGLPTASARAFHRGCDRKAEVVLIRAIGWQSVTDWARASVKERQGRPLIDLIEKVEDPGAGLQAVIRQYATLPRNTLISEQLIAERRAEARRDR